MTSYGVFRYLAASEHADLYRAVMLRFVAAKERFTIHLRPVEIAEGLPAGSDPAAALVSLVEWGNLRADPDTARVSTVEEFNRARFIYRMTSEGEAAERALGDFDRTLGAAGALQSWALDDIVEQLEALVLLAAEAAVDEAKAGQALSLLSERFTGLAENAQVFTGDLRRTIDLRGVDTEAFVAYKERLIGYLQRFIQDLLQRTAEIGSLLERLDGSDIERLLLAAATREARDAAPEADADDAALEFVLERWRARFRGFRHWFLGGRGEPSQSQQLRHLALNAIPELLAVVQRLGERQAGRSDRAADYRALAVWFAESSSDDARHRLASVAFGLGGARHLAVTRATLEARELQDVSPGTSWADAPAEVISPRLRATGSYERRGSPTRLRDRSTDRFTVERAVAAERTETERLQEQLLTDEPVPLGAFPLQDAGARNLLLHLAGDALAQRSTPEEHVSTASLDGRFQVTVLPETGGKRTTLLMNDGALRGPAHRFAIRSRR